MNVHNVQLYYPYRFGFPCTVDVYSVDVVRNTKKRGNTTLCKQLALGFDHFYFYGFRPINCPRERKNLYPVSL